MKTSLRFVLILLLLPATGQLLAQEVTLTHSASLEITHSGVSCGSAEFRFTGENHYWRLFNLADFGVMDDFTIVSIDLGIGSLDLRGSSQMSTLKIQDVQGDFLLANLSTLYETNVALHDSLSLKLINVPVESVTIAAGGKFAVEWEPVNGTPDEDHGPLEITFGANDAGQTGGTYIYAPSCGDDELADLGTVGPGFPDSHWVLAINGVAPVAVEDDVAPSSFILAQNYPNPFNPKTTIPFSLNAPAHVSLEVFDLQGNEVATLLDRPLLQGEHEIAFDAADLPSGVYVYRLAADGQTQMKTLVLLK